MRAALRSHGLGECECTVRFSAVSEAVPPLGKLGLAVSFL